MSVVAPSGQRLQPQQQHGNWHQLDSFASSLLGDDNAHGSDLPVYHAFHPRRGCFLGLRRAFAVVSFIIMVAWLVMDVSLAQMNALVPGLKDALQFQSVQFTDQDKFSGQSYAELIKTGKQPGPPPGSRITCSCGFNNKSVQVPPSFQMEPRPRNTTESPLIPSIEWCIKGNVTSDVAWMHAPDNSSATVSLTPILNKLWFALHYANVWNPKTPAVLSLAAWRVAMATEAHIRARSSYLAARAELLNEAEFATALSRDVRGRFQQLGTHYMDALLAGYSTMVARLWGVEADMADIIRSDSFDPTKGDNGTTERMTCSQLPLDVPFAFACVLWQDTACRPARAAVPWQG